MIYRFRTNDGRRGCALALSGAQAAERMARLLLGDGAKVEGLLFTGVKPGPRGTVKARTWRAHLCKRPTPLEEYRGARSTCVWAEIAEGAKPPAPPEKWPLAPLRPADRL